MDIPGSVAALERDLRGIVGDRLQSLVVYGTEHDSAARGTDHATSAAHHHAPTRTHTLAVIDRLSADDLRACASRVAHWHDQALATPLLVAAHEFERALDAFPFEFGAILSHHQVVAGTNPFDGLRVDPADLRRACEVQARSHLLHLREGYLEALGRGDRLAVLIVASAAPFGALVAHLAQLDGSDAVGGAAARRVEAQLGLSSDIISRVVALATVQEIPSADAVALFPSYLTAVERLVQYVDTWQ
jgi:hypothetical protein